MKKVSTVEKSMPPSTAMPSGARESPPAPRPSAIGRMPTMVASAVIRIGRKRVFEACCTASTSGSPRSRSWFANSTIRIEFLVTRPTSITSPILLNRLSVVWVASSATSAPVKESATATRIVTRVDEALELGRQHQVDHDDREPVGEQQRVARREELLRLARRSGSRSRRAAPRCAICVAISRPSPCVRVARSAEIMTERCRS